MAKKKLKKAKKLAGSKALTAKNAWPS